MRFGLMGAVLALVVAVAVQLGTVAVAGRCAPSVAPGWAFGEVVRIGGCEPPALVRGRRP